MNSPDIGSEASPLPELARRLARLGLCTVAYLGVLAAIYAAHVRWWRVDVVFYSALSDGLLAILAAGLLSWWFRWWRTFSVFERVQMLLVWSLIGYAFAISVPTVIDRSLSFYILEKLQQHGGGLERDRFETLFTQTYAREHHLVEVRLTEQLQSGTVTLADGCVRLTTRGKRLATFSRWFRTNLLPRHRLLMGQYTDVLTDPFRNGAREPDDGCRQAAPAM